MSAQEQFPSPPPNESFRSIKSSVVEFKENFAQLPPENQPLVMKANIWAKEAHEGIYREDGSPFYEGHILPVFNIAFSYGIRDKFMLSGLLIHDVIEDTKRAKDTKDWNNTRSRQESEDVIRKEFGQEIAALLMPNTKPKVDRIEILDKKQASDVGITYFKQGSADSVLMKGFDRIQNLETLDVPTFTIEKKRRICLETEQHIIPTLREVAGPKYPDIIEQMIERMRRAMAPYLPHGLYPEVY